MSNPHRGNVRKESHRYAGKESAVLSTNQVLVEVKAKW